MTRLAETVLGAIKGLEPCTFGAVYGFMAQTCQEDQRRVRAAILELWDLGRISVGSDRFLRTVE